LSNKDFAVSDLQSKPQSQATLFSPAQLQSLSQSSPASPKSSKRLKK